MSRTLTIHAGEITTASTGRTYRDLEVLAFDAFAAGDYRAAHIYCMAGALVAATSAEQDTAFEAANEALVLATTFQPDPLPVVAETPAAIVPVILDWNIPVYSGKSSAPYYGPAPVGASWRRPTARPSGFA